jgi:hypothetical protein
VTPAGRFSGGRQLLVASSAVGAPIPAGRVSGAQWLLASAPRVLQEEP